MGTVGFGDAHDALEDVKATLYVYNKIKADAPEAD